MIGGGSKVPYFDKEWLCRAFKALSKLEDSPEKKVLIEELQQVQENHGMIKSLVFSKNMCEKLEKIMGDDGVNVLKECSCHYSEEEIKALKAYYKETGSIEAVHKKLEEEYYKMLKTSKELTSNQLEIVKSNSWGIAGTIQGDEILVTEVPDELSEYFETTDKGLKAAYYCHCKRIKEGIKFGFDLPGSYCHCGAGFYEHLWYEITGRTVEVNQISSVLKGENCCQFCIKFK